jgi:hypothetical protein
LANARSSSHPHPNIPAAFSVKRQNENVPLLNEVDEMMLQQQQQQQQLGLVKKR